MIKLKDIIKESKKNKWKINFEVEIPEGKGYHYLYNKIYQSFLEMYVKHEKWKIKKLIIKQ